MSSDTKYFWGIDCGSSEIKVVVTDPAGKILHKQKKRTLFPLIDHVRRALNPEGPVPSPLNEKGAVTTGHFLTATGYGRSHIDFISNKLTEIKAHALGVQHQLNLSGDYTIVDIGGQDSKVILVKNGDVAHFVINRKCAAGTGSFIEELAHRLEIKLEDMTALEKKHDANIPLNSYCTVFAGQEVIKVLMNGEKVENLIHALYESVVKRITEMTGISTELVVFSGGVLAYHPALHEIFQKKLGGKKFLLAPESQFCGALGAAIHGISHLSQSTG